jgi:hypothetical protein
LASVTVSDELGLQNLPPDHRSRTPALPVAPLFAFAKEPPSVSAAAATAIVGSFMAIPLRMIMNSGMGKPGSTAFQDDPVAKVDGFCK